MPQGLNKKLWEHLPIELSADRKKRRNMEAIKVDTSNPKLFETPEFPVLPAGVHLFAVAAMGKPVPCQEGPNLVIKAEFRCQDEEPAENKGMVVFENFVIITEVPNEKAAKARKINQQQMTTFCLACGVTTKEQVQETGELPIAQTEGAFFKALTGVRNNTYMGETRKQHYVKKYLFEEKAEA